jgi:hypothetical protein
MVGASLAWHQGQARNRTWLTMATRPKRGRAVASPKPSGLRASGPPRLRRAAHPSVTSLILFRAQEGSPHAFPMSTSSSCPSAVAVFGASDREAPWAAWSIATCSPAASRGPAMRSTRSTTGAGPALLADLAALDKHVDLALIATPAETVPGILDQCGEWGRAAAVVHSAGFAEHGERGAPCRSAWWRRRGATASACWGRTASA